ncbi:MAG: PIN domain-containing protein [Caldimonas sp.]
MFANRFTVLVDACSLFDVLGRNMLLSLAKWDFYRLSWSAKILDETERALAKAFEARGHTEPAHEATRQRQKMEAAFEEAAVTGFERLVASLSDLPDQGDAHVVAAALKTRASVIVTENLKHFPASILEPLDLEAKSADAFIADTISLDPGRAVAAIRQMRERFNRPEKTAEVLLLDLERHGFTETVDALKEHAQSL